MLPYLEMQRKFGTHQVKLKERAKGQLVKFFVLPLDASCHLRSSVKSCTPQRLRLTGDCMHIQSACASDRRKQGGCHILRHFLKTILRVLLYTLGIQIENKSDKKVQLALYSFVLHWPCQSMVLCLWKKEKKADISWVISVC